MRPQLIDRILYDFYGVATGFPGGDATINRNEFDDGS